MIDKSPGLYTRQQVLELIGVRYSTLWCWMRDGRFPLPREIGAPGGRRTSLRWLKAEVDDWVLSRPIRRYRKGAVKS